MGVFVWVCVYVCMCTCASVCMQVCVCVEIELTSVNTYISCNLGEGEVSIIILF